MFTGLVEALGTVVENETRRHRAAARPRRARRIAPRSRPRRERRRQRRVPHRRGATTTGTFAFEAGPETLRRTNLGDFRPGDRVNLERSLRLGDRLGGHMVTGHVDGLGTVAERVMEGEWLTVWFACPDELAATDGEQGVGRGRRRQPHRSWTWSGGDSASRSSRTRWKIPPWASKRSAHVLTWNLICWRNTSGSASSIRREDDLATDEHR